MKGIPTNPAPNRIDTGGQRRYSRLGWATVPPQRNLQMISQIYHACLQIGNRPNGVTDKRLVCGFNNKAKG